jgi:hypothetical protein
MKNESEYLGQSERPWKRSCDLLITKNTSPLSNLTELEKKQQKKATELGKDPVLWFNRIEMETLWKHQ